MKIRIKEKVFDTCKFQSSKTPIYVGVNEIKVDLISYPPNPYKVIVEMALTTWGSNLKKWILLSPEERFYAVSSVLRKKALPLGLESPLFVFGVSNVSRSSFDQIARTRIGATISSLGWNNIHSETGFRIPNEIFDKYDKYEEISSCLEKIKSLYCDMVLNGISWQSAREILPLGLLHWFYFSITYLALQNFCSRRLCFSEKEDTVATAWLMRERVKEKFPLLALCLRPSCDFSKRCSYHLEDSLPEHMGSLFKSCGRNLCNVSNPNVEFDIPSTDVNNLRSQLGINIPNADEDLPPVKFDDLEKKDIEAFSND